MSANNFYKVGKCMLRSVFVALLLTSAGIASAEESRALFDFGHLKLREGTHLAEFLQKVDEHETSNKLIPSQREDLVAIFRQYDFDKNGQLNATEMLVGCMKPLNDEQLIAYKEGKKKKGGGGGGDVPGPVETGCTGTCNCDYIPSFGGGALETEGAVPGTGDPQGGYPGTNQNCVASGDPNCHCHCNTGVCAAGGT